MVQQTVPSCIFYFAATTTLPNFTSLPKKWDMFFDILLCEVRAVVSIHIHVARRGGYFSTPVKKCANSAQKLFCCLMYNSRLHIKTATQKSVRKNVQKVLSPLLPDLRLMTHDLWLIIPIWGIFIPFYTHLYLYRNTHIVAHGAFHLRH